MHMSLFAIFLIFSPVNGCNTQQHGNTQHSVVNRVLRGKTIITLSPIGIKQCSKICSTRGECLSYNYRQSNFTCELNHADETTDSLDIDSNYVYYSKQVPPQIDIGACANITCGSHSQCVEIDGYGPYCFSTSCGSPPSKSNAILSSGGNLVGTTRYYTCLSEHFTEGTTSLTCKSDGQWSNSDLYCRPYRWPLGTYGLYQTNTGCPGNAVWNDGYRDHDTADNVNAKSVNYHLAGYVSRYGIATRFCMRTTEIQTSDELQWQPGSYCLLKKGDCPTGFSSGYILWDDDDFDNDNTYSGTMPDGIYDSDTKIYYCCRTDGSASNPLYLPTSQPFYLLRKGGVCQAVDGRNIVEEWILYDCEDNGGVTSSSGNTPDHSLSGSPDVKLFFCYYY